METELEVGDHVRVNDNAPRVFVGAEGHVAEVIEHGSGSITILVDVEGIGRRGFSSHTLDLIARAPEPAPEAPRLNQTKEAEILLSLASETVAGDRQKDYGRPEDNFATIAGFWNCYLQAIGVDVDLVAHDVALMMDLMKTARLCNSPDHKDSYVDKAGYTALAYQTSPAQK